MQRKKTDKWSQMFRKTRKVAALVKDLEATAKCLVNHQQKPVFRKKKKYVLSTL